MKKETRIPEIRNSQAQAWALYSSFGFRYSFVLGHSGFVTPCLLRVATTTRTSFAMLLLLGCAGCASPSPKPVATAEQEIRAVLEAQVRAWNAGDLRGFMDGYARSDWTRFQSGGEVSLGWQTVFERYQKRYGNPAQMGTLTFSDLEVTVLAPDAALAFGRWRLDRAQETPSGLFTLLFRRTA